MGKNLSQVVAEIFAKPMDGKELASQTRRFGDEIRKAAQGEETIYGKFRGLLESFRTIIPDEQQRYQAVLQALATTAKLNRQDIIQAINGQLEELKTVEKGFEPAQAAWRNELTAMDARSQQLNGEMAQLRDRLVQLENEDKTIQAGKASRQKDLELAEKAVGELFAQIGSEISSLRNKVAELPAETQAPLPGSPPSAVQPMPAPAPPVQQVTPLQKTIAEKQERGEQKIEIQGASVKEETKWLKKCPMCGGPFNLLELEKKWQCFTCGHEEAAEEQLGIRQTDDVKIETQAAAPAPENTKEESKWLKKCPMCGGPFNLLELEKKWQCYTCGYEEPTPG